MAKYGGEDRVEIVPGTHPVTKHPMPVRRRVGARSLPSGTPMDLLAGRRSADGVSQLADLPEPDWDDLAAFDDCDDDPTGLSRLWPVTHLLVSGGELPELTVLLPAEAIPDPVAVAPVANDQWAKPKGGLWTAPRTGDTESAWTRWCADNDHQPKGAEQMTLWSMSVPDDVVVVKVSDPVGAKDLHTAFHEDATDGISRMYALIDYEGLAAAGVDAIWLTEDAARAASGNVFTTNPTPFNLWDCETVLWLRPPATTSFTRLGDMKLS
jgi:hypothetical protein